MRESVTAVIPAYNEAHRIAATLRHTRPWVDRLIVVDDASSDDTVAIAKAEGASVIQLSRNSGYVAAIKAGFAAVETAIVVTLDADGEFSAADIPRLVTPIVNNEADMVQGQRSWIPRPSERFLNWLADRKSPVGDSGTGLRALRSALAQSLEIRGACICGILTLEVASRGGRILNLPIELRETGKPRRIAWFHLRQLVYLLPWLFKR